jgi:sugar lactone lactonase YvrE
MLPSLSTRFNYVKKTVFSLLLTLLVAACSSESKPSIGTAANTAAIATSAVYRPFLVTTLAGETFAHSHADGQGRAAHFDFPCDVVIAPTGLLYVADAGTSTIRQITPQGLVTTLAGKADHTGSLDGRGEQALFNQPTGMAIDRAGTLYVADQLNHTIRKVTAAGVVTTLAGKPGSPGNTDGKGSTARFHAPSGVAVDPAGMVYVADITNHTIRKITPAGVVTTLAGQAGQGGRVDGPGNTARFYYPGGLTCDAAGTLYVFESPSVNLRKITPQGVVSTLPIHNYSVAPQATRGIDGVAVDKKGSIYLTDAFNHLVLKVTPAGNADRLAGQVGVYGDRDGLTLSEASFNGPGGIAVDATGKVYVADNLNGTIRVIQQAQTKNVAR